MIVNYERYCAVFFSLLLFHLYIKILSSTSSESIITWSRNSECSGLIIYQKYFSCTGRNYRLNLFMIWSYIVACGLDFCAVWRQRKEELFLSVVCHAWLIMHANDEHDNTNMIEEFKNSASRGLPRPVVLHTIHVPDYINILSFPYK